MFFVFIVFLYLLILLLSGGLRVALVRLVFQRCDKVYGL